MSEPPTLRPGQYSQHYLILAALGAGGMSEVHLGYDFLHARLVAIKRLAAPLAANARILDSFLREGELLQRLRHPSILRVHEITRDEDGTAQVVLEYVHGQHLGRLLRAPVPVPLRTAVRALEDAAGALSLAHRRGVVHRDVKPQNIIWKPRGRAVVIDFGIAHSAHPEEVEGNLDALGTPAYASPEQRRGAAVDARSDVWSLGAVLYELLTGARVIPKGDRDAMLGARSDQVAPPDQLRPEVPAELAGLCLAMLEDAPADRVESMTRVLVELGRLREGLEPRARDRVFGTELDRQLDLAFWSWDRGEAVRAAELLDEVEAAPGSGEVARVHQLRAHLREQAGRPEHAIREFQVALELDPGALDVYVELGTLLLRMAKFDALGELLVRVPPALEHTGPVVVLRNLYRQLPRVPTEVLERFGFAGVAVQLQRKLTAHPPGPGGRPEADADGLLRVPKGTFERPTGFATKPRSPSQWSGSSEWGEPED